MEEDEEDIWSFLRRIDPSKFPTDPSKGRFAILFDDEIVAYSNIPAYSGDVPQGSSVTIIPTNPEKEAEEFSKFWVKILKK